jgi:hypothetical protein
MFEQSSTDTTVATSPRHPSRSSSIRSAWVPRVVGLGLLAFSGALVACGGAGSAGAAAASNPPGTIVADPTGNGLRLFVDANSGGGASEVRVTRTVWGRLVQVFGRGPFGDERVPMNQNFLISATLNSQGSFTLELNPVTSQQIMIIERDVTDLSPGGGRDQFYDLLKTTEANLSFVQDQAQTSSGVFTMVPRNCTMMVQFDDLLDAGSIDSRTVRVLTGSPASLPFEARVFGDPNHGDLQDRNGDGTPEFYTTRVLIDLAISEIESFETDPPLATNGVGLPSATDQNQSNALLRIPTEVNSLSGQPYILRNLNFNGLAITQNGSVDTGSITDDVVRAVRSGGQTAVTGDNNNGFLRDDNAPVLVGSLPAVIPPSATIVYDPVDNEFLISDFVFDSQVCAQAPIIGDVLVQPGVFAEVVAARPVNFGTVTDLRVRLLLFPDAWTGPEEWASSAVGPTSFRSAYDPVADAGKAGCFITVFPQASGYPENPNQNIFTSSSVRMNFSEPMDPDSLTAFDSMTLTRNPVPPPTEDPLPTSDYVIGSVAQSLDLRGFTFVPDLPLAHLSGISESYFLRLASQEEGPTDLAGNPIDVDMPSIELTVRSGDSSQLNGGRVSRFTSADEEPPLGTPVSGPRPEWAGQILYRPDLGEIHPRPVERYLALADRTRAVPGLMTPFPQGVQTPLSSLGSLCQTLWRYLDFGFSLEDTLTHDIDIEGMYWSPATGQVLFDSFEEFSITLSHCRYAPDEFIDPGSLFPQFNASGLFTFYTNNTVNAAESPPRIVHPRFLGYTVDPGQQIFSGVPPANTRLMPWPLNRNVPDEEKIFYTWRDTSVRARGGFSNGGVPPNQYFVANNLPQPNNDYYRVSQAQTVGLPLLMEFRCYPDSGAAGINSFAISLAANSSSQPYFRAFSTGGTNTSGQVIVRDPDTQVLSLGGFNPASTPFPGLTTYGRDNSFYTGALDIVVRVSRAVSVWFPANDPTTGAIFDTPVFGTPILEPRPESQPAGTRLDLEFRGAADVAIPVPYPTNPASRWPRLNDDCPAYEAIDFAPNGDLLEHPALGNALSLDTYGDHYMDEPCTFTAGFGADHGTLFDNLGIVFLAGNSDVWYDDVSIIDGAKYYQVRLNFQSNEVSGQSPVLSAFALSWSE